MSVNACVPVPFTDMPGCRWFWENYNKCLQWQGNCQLAYFKAKVTALQIENDILHKQIHHLVEQNDNLTVQNQSLVNGMNPDFLVDSYSFYERHQETGCLRPQVDYYNSSSQHYQYSAESMNVCDDSGDSDDEEYKLSEEFVKFIEISFRHKMEMKKLKEGNVKGISRKKEIKNVEGDATDNEEGLYDKIYDFRRKEKRAIEMSLLYGEAAPKIHAMETAIQLSFNRNFDVFHPTLWPQIPFNIGYAEDPPN